MTLIILMNLSDDIVQKRIAVGKKIMSGENVLFLDTETNGIGTFRPVTQDVVQLAWVFNGCVNSYFIKGATKIHEKVPHQITIEFLEEHGDTFEKVWPLFYSDFQKAEKLVAHNVDFDIGVLMYALYKYMPEFNESGNIVNFGKRCEKIGVCSMKKAVDYCKIPKKGFGAKYPGFKWPTLTEWHEVVFSSIPLEPLHDAKNDCKILERCYLKCETQEWKSPIKKYYQGSSSYIVPTQ